MRRAPAALALLGLALLLAPGPAAALLACLPPGCIQGHPYGYNPQAMVLRSGQAVRWAAIDGDLHTSTEGLDNGGRPCFDELFAASPGRLVTFAFDPEGRLTARAGNAPPAPCAMSPAEPGRAAVVPYLCRLHPVMRGVLVVVP